MGKHKKPDRLSQTAAEALEHGMSYGKYMAKYHPSASRQEPVKPMTGIIKVCEHCGKEFTPLKSTKQKYCCANCRNSANYQQLRENMLDQRAAAGETVSENPSGGKAVTKVCKQCGKQFTPESGHFKYCSDECRRMENAQRNLEAYYRKRKGNDMYGILEMESN